ncbi:hypothetical protein LTR53_009534 [Teratosphaeriaceae sp. CCFEE 6253]|nr:hypothetical protein LTR53_009534 [Teratosphaeriaceae sp. CCFEE 6253]
MAPTLTDKDHQVLMLVLQCIEGGPFKIDTQKLADLGPWKDKASANTAWCNLKTKLFPKTRESNGQSETAHAAKGSGGKKCGATEVEDAEGEVDGDSGDVNPAPKKRGRPSKAKPVEEITEVAAGEAEVETEKAPEVKRGRGRPKKAVAKVDDSPPLADGDGEHEGETAAADDEAGSKLEEAPVVKRGRGRPKKVVAEEAKAGTPMEGDGEHEEEAAAALTGAVKNEAKTD